MREVNVEPVDPGVGRATSRAWPQSVDGSFQMWNDSVMELSDLRIFLRVFDSGSLSPPARTIGLPQSSVSRALNRLRRVEPRTSLPS